MRRVRFVEEVWNIIIVQFHLIQKMKIMLKLMMKMKIGMTLKQMIPIPILKRLFMNFMTK